MSKDWKQQKKQFLINLLGIIKLDRERNQSENGCTEHCSGNAAGSTEVATVLRANGHKQNTETSTEVRVSQWGEETGRSK